ncbi:glutamate N-acetyltransferase/amino-acid N-acetyltransferase [Rhodobium orientis]|uniref:Arginine biosynthesis bifunctional protein ArgJ n=1 Tax=Rhodobium orientis TaxID=34017 RepID=A0A327JFD0_9HYPH|nr:bifunctional glutamate N-acetyltransferase/amino-acid acetyltransferase ArgJ [Rhodobium orientis]MBB4305567.1 glutamate N-acetyltransferase/amino-acid N-acetyltransferase [Rhodobium orientis]MBK5948745.1 bifunctional ornithine acetyltransferase/N-acetylglutamate synthase [Rhodobium orientis]RAI25100.1 bifunctional ornithine acetyltransferase/N-acetylglutamate synthase [Rhodobium orientis]
MELTPSPFAPASYAEPPQVAGVRLATAAAGIKYKGRTDVLAVVFDGGAEVAGVFTKSKCASAPVDWCKANLAGGRAGALLVNSGNANAFTGKRGAEAVKLSADQMAAAAGCKPQEVYLASTGVIGEPLDASKFGAVVDGLVRDAVPGRFLDAAKAIMTTDTFPKLATATAKIGGVETTIVGIAKGSGMIAPDMATMLSFVFTDAPVAAPVLQKLLSRGVKDSFNAVTVDGDTSTSDTVLAFATGAAAKRGAPEITEPGDRRLAAFRKAFGGLLLDLAHQVVKDGEGARKFVAITVEGATSKASARRIGMAIANSPLVKTAIAGEDANWGRIVMAVGKAGEPADRDRLAIWFGDVRVAVEGERDPDYSEAAASAVMKEPEIAIRVDLGLGTGRDTVWTCDLTKGYIAINGDYRS